MGFRGHVEGGAGQLMVCVDQEAIDGVLGDSGGGEEVAVGVAGG